MVPAIWASPNQPPVVFSVLTGDVSSTPMPINAAGLIVGASGSNLFSTSTYINGSHAVTGASVNSSVIALPLLPGLSGRLIYVAAASINTAGVIVGGSSENINNHGVIWKNGQVQVLNTLIPSGNSQTLNAATLITDQGWILGSIDNRVAGPFRNAPNVSNNIWYTGIQYILIPK